ncbi:FtsX-like permease family protein [Streptomyces sp. NPDC050610]|uniref:FtsX-like permease family protein n=1 Tax=Streptomyces sp. NPDC050610 TaxID=3157097 RepID=UPI00343061CA
MIRLPVPRLPRLPRLPNLPAWRAALRIARRDALRAKARSALVVAMIALPVLAVAAADVIYRSGSPTRAETVDRSLGAADARFTDGGFGPVPLIQTPNAQRHGRPADYQHHDDSDSGGDTDADGDVFRDGDGVEDADEDENSNGESSIAPIDHRPVDIPAALPPGARVVTSQDVDGLVHSAHGLKRSTIRELRAADPMMRGKVRLNRGVFPSGSDEMAATRAYLESSGLHVGSRTKVKGLNRVFRITGELELPGQLRGEVLFADPGAVIAPWRAQAKRDAVAAPPHPSDKEYYVTTKGHGVAWSDVLAANRRGAVVYSRQVALKPPPEAEVPAVRIMNLGSGSGYDGSYGETDLVSWRNAYLAAVGALALLEIVLLAGPAFAVGARRSRRQLGLVGVCGGDRGQVRAVVLAGGVVLGGAGAVLGVAGGIGLTALCRPLVEQWAGRRFGAIDIRPLELLAIGATGLLAGVLAALAPAVVAARQSVLTSLTERRGVRRSSRTLPVLGLAALLLGVGLAVVAALTGLDSLFVAVGSVIAELGVLALVPAMVGACGRIGRGLPLTPRLALRDAARNRGRTAPAVSAVLAAVAGTVAVATYSVSQQAEERFGYVPSLKPRTVALMVDAYADQGGHPEKALPALRRTVERLLPVSGGRADVERVWAGGDCYSREAVECGSIELVRPKGNECPLRGPAGARIAAGLSAAEHRQLMRTPRCVDSDGAYSMIGGIDDRMVVGDASLLRNYVGLRDPAAERALAEGKPVLLNPAYARHGRLTLKITGLHSGPTGPRQDQKPTHVSLAAYTAPAAYAGTPSIRLVLPPSLAHRLGLHTAPAGSFYPMSRTPTRAEQQRAETELAHGDAATDLYVERGYPATDNAALLVLAVFAGIVTIGAAAIATGLAKADAEADLTTLGAVGAPPRVRRLYTGLQCAVVAGMGVLLGTVTGVLPAVALRLSDGQHALAHLRRNPMASTYTPIELPWPTLAALAVGVPVLAGLLAALCTRSRLLAPRRAT